MSNVLWTLQIMLMIGIHKLFHRGLLFIYLMDLMVDMQKQCFIKGPFGPFQVFDESHRTKFLSKFIWNLERYSLNFLYIYFFSVNFENLIIEFYISYVLNMRIKFHSNWILFTSRSIKLFFIHNFRSQNLKFNIFLMRQQLIFDLLEILKA